MSKKFYLDNSPARPGAPFPFEDVFICAAWSPFIIDRPMRLSSQPGRPRPAAH